MDTTTLVAIGAIVMANIGTTIGLFTWATSHAANDNRDTKRILETIQAETKDFHARLCVIEAERNQILRETRK
jgi:hypothetical protein